MLCFDKILPPKSYHQVWLNRWMERWGNWGGCENPKHLCNSSVSGYLGVSLKHYDKLFSHFENSALKYSEILAWNIFKWHWFSPMYPSRTWDMYWVVSKLLRCPGCNGEENHKTICTLEVQLPLPRNFLLTEIQYFKENRAKLESFLKAPNLSFIDI